LATVTDGIIAAEAGVSLGAAAGGWVTGTLVGVAAGDSLAVGAACPQAATTRASKSNALAANVTGLRR